jgi:hypothetical protein
MFMISTLAKQGRNVNTDTFMHYRNYVNLTVGKVKPKIKSKKKLKRYTLVKNNK